MSGDQHTRKFAGNVTLVDNMLLHPRLLGIVDFDGNVSSNATYYQMLLPIGSRAIINGILPNEEIKTAESEHSS